MAEKPLNVVIVGGSLTGLFHGVVLKRLGHNVRILERSLPETLSAQGAGIIAREEVQAFFTQYDTASPAYFVHAEPKIKFLNLNAEVTKIWNVQLCMTSWDTLYWKLRALFDGRHSEDFNEPFPEVKTEKLLTSSYEYGATVTNIRYRNGLVTLEYDRVARSGRAQYANADQLEADLVIAADGPSSHIRSMLYPKLRRQYVGYVAWRGTVVESAVSDEAKSLFGTCCNFFNHAAGHMLLYTIPGKNGSLLTGERLLNYVWYCNYAEDSPELASLMTDKDGHKHRITMPMGKMRSEVWAAQQKYARDILPAALAELVEKTEQPFVQCITDVSAPKAVHFDGHLLLTGDALCTFRPHVGASTNQAALHALLLEKVLTKKITLEEWECKCLEYAKLTSLLGIAWGSKNQFGFFTFLVSAIWLALAYLQMYGTRAYAWIGKASGLHVKNL